MNMKERPSDEFIALLKQSGSSDKAVAIEAQREIAKALETPLRKGVLFGDVVTSIYEAMPLEPGATPEFPNGTYYYIVNDEFPGIPRYLVGTPSKDFKLGPG